MDNTFKNSTVEALILASPEPLAAKKIADLMDGLTPSKVAAAVAQLNDRYMQSGSSFRIRELAGGYQFYIVPEFTGFVEEMFARTRKMRLTRAALETLAIIAYKQPVTKIEVEQIRGVASDGVLHNLLEKNMITVKGRANTVGKPLQYGTTDEFLKFFGLNRMDDLPKMSEIEALVASAEPQSQTELLLQQADDEDRLTLNVADDTFDRGERNEPEDITGDPEGHLFETQDDNGNHADEHEDESQSASPGHAGEKTGLIVDVDET